MLEDLKMLLGVTDKDNVLNYCLRKATNQVIAYTKQDNAYVVTLLQDTIIELAIIRYNRMSTEGLQSESYSGVSNTFINDIPEDIKKVLRSHRKCYK